MMELNKFPSKPGVYLMRDKSDKVLYIGKAKNLASRVKQYFSGTDTRASIPYLIAKVDRIETIVVTSEKEALLLEDTLIKEHQPTYNILLKDDKSYLALQVRRDHPWPSVNLVRIKGQPKDKNLYFGPYTSALAAKETLEEIRKLFPLRQCSDQELAKRTRPCILYQMKRCIAPCVGLCTKEAYNEEVDQTIDFLKGETKHVLKKMWQELDKASDLLEYEKAAYYLHKIRQIEKTLESQSVNLLKQGDFEIVGLYREADRGDLALISYRSGKLMGVTHFPFEKSVQEDDELIESALLQYFKGAREAPKEIIVPLKLTPGLGELLKTKVIHPIRGDKKKLIEIALQNATEHFAQFKNKRDINTKTLAELQKLCHLEKYPCRIDCFDTANMAGSDPTASLVTFLEGEPERKSYRSYKIRSTEDQPNDYQAMEEVLTRRYQKLKSEELPDLIIVDGGKGQLTSALKVLSKLNITTVDLIALSKEEAKHTKAMTQEKIFLVNRKDPIILPRHCPLLFFLQRVRDEAHRRAITLHKKGRKKGLIKSALDSIPGIGPKKRSILLKHFGSVKALSKATAQELERVQGITKKDVLQISDWQKDL